MDVSHTGSHPESAATSPSRSRAGIGTHLTVVAAGHIALGTLGVLIFGLPVLIVMVTGAWVWEVEMLFASTITALVLGIFVVLSLPGIIGGIGLLLRHGWARVVLLVVSFLQLINFPLGTALGIYTIWVLFQDDAREVFARPAHEVGA